MTSKRYVILMTSNMGKSRKHDKKHMKTLSVTLTAYKNDFKSVVILIAFFFFKPQVMFLSLVSSTLSKNNFLI